MCIIWIHEFRVLTRILMIRVHDWMPISIRVWCAVVHKREGQSHCVRVLSQVGRPIVENSSRAAKLESCLRWAPPKLQVETWECRVVTSRWTVSETVVPAGGCEVMVHKPSAERFPESPGPGERFRRALGWTPLLRTQNSGGLGFLGCPAGGAAVGCARVVSGLGCNVHLPHCMGGNPALLLPISVWAVSNSWATNWRALLGVAPRFVEGRCTSRGALVRRGGCADEREPELLRRFGVVCTLAPATTRLHSEGRGSPSPSFR